jgi:hypothetical protein
MECWSVWCDVTKGYISNIYTAEGEKPEETIFPSLEPYLDLWQHVYQDDYYNSAEIGRKLLIRKKRVCRSIRTSRVIPKSVAGASKNLKRGDPVCRQEGDVLLHIWKDNTEFRMISRRDTNKSGERKKQANLLNSVRQIHEQC